MDINNLVLSSGGLNGINMVGVLYGALSKNILKSRIYNKLLKMI